MEIGLGNLEYLPAKERADLIAPVVYEAISRLNGAETIGVAEIDPGLSDTAAFCAKYEVGMDQSANCVVLEATRADKTWFAACVILGSTKADVNGLARRTLDARRVSFAQMQQAVEKTGMEFGAITPIGLPEGWPTLIDKTAVDSDYVIIGSGLRKSKLAIPGKLLVELPNAQILEGLGRAF